jgi:hypothetical protein
VDGAVSLSGDHAQHVDYRVCIQGLASGQLRAQPSAIFASLRWYVSLS